MENNTNVTKYFILSELGKGRMHGYSLMASIEKITGRKPSPSQIYPLMKRLEKAGYVSISITMHDRKKAKYYRLTKKGIKLFNTMNKRFDALINATLSSRIKICAHCKCEIIKGSYKKRIKDKCLDFCCTSCADSF